MLKIFKISTTIILATFLTGCNKPEPDQISGDFFRYTVNVIYKGQPLQIEYPAACKYNISRNIDGDRSVDGASLAPSVFGVETPDGGALVIKTPNFCDYSKAIDANEVPSSYNPLIVHYQDSKSPTFGLGYYGAEAFESPLSVMKFTSSKTERITGKDFSDWRRNNPDANWVTYERMNANRNIFKRTEWKLGDRHLASVCRGAFFYTPPKEFQSSLTKAWVDAGRPTYWVDTTVNSKIRAIEPVDRFTPKERRRETSLFGKYPMYMYGYNGNEVKERAYPSETDFDMNRTDPTGKSTATYLEHSTNFFMLRDKRDRALTKDNIVFKEDKRGFLFCNSHDGNHIDVANFKKVFGDEGKEFGTFPGLYLLNGIEIEGEEKSIPHYAWGIGSLYSFYEDKYIIRHRKINYYSLGDKL